MSTHRKKDANIFMPLLWGNLMKKHFHPGRAPSNPGNSAKHTETRPSDCSPRLLQGPTRRTTWTVPWWASSGLRATPWTARMPTTKCSPLWNWRLGHISLSRVVYYSLLGLVWYGIDCISMLIDINCILVWLTRLAKYIYSILIVLYICGWLCLKTSWKLVSALYSHGQMLNAKIVAGKAMHLLQILMLVFIVRRSLYNIMMHCYLHFTSVQFEWLYRTANALSACTDHDQSYHSSHRSTSHNSAQGTVITPSSVTCVRRDGVRDELRETCPISGT